MTRPLSKSSIDALCSIAESMKSRGSSTFPMRAAHFSDLRAWERRGLVRRGAPGRRSFTPLGRSFVAAYRLGFVRGWSRRDREASAGLARIRLELERDGDVAAALAVAERERDYP